MFAELQVTTPEGVTFKHEIAGVGSRCLASALDFIFYIVSLIALSIIAGILSLAMGGAGDGFVLAFVSIANFTLLWGYRTFMETYKSGSFGYKVMGLTVVTGRGAKPMFWQCAIRGLLWPVEAVMLSIIGFVSIIVTKKSQRLADLITGTIVVHRNRDARIGMLQVQSGALDPNAAFRSWEVSHVSDDEVFLIRRFLERRTYLPQHIRLELANRLYKLIYPKVSGIPTNWYAEAVLEGIAAAKAVANER
ncbi:MAG: RDD family protein [Acidimicrobiia bacterium]